MKKIVGFFGIFALIAGFVTSCGDDDDDDEVFVQKRLVKLTKGGDSSEFKYDSDGRCVAYNFFKDGEIYVKSSYKYEGNTMTIESYNNGTPETYSATLNSKGDLESRDFVHGKFKYEYDNQGHLIAEYYHNENGSVDTTKYEWEDGNLVKKNNGAYIISYKYTNKNHTSPIENKSGLQFFTPYNFDGALDGLLGIPCKNIPVSFVYEYFAEEGDMVLDYLKGTEIASKWMFDKNGYPISVVYDDGNGKRTTEFVWE
ncbi:MAG: hypothetical protein PUC42_10700 [Bacteroidales bacterium]|nr:hypothetical protein [Bacteroidales bacterium]